MRRSRVYLVVDGPSDVAFWRKQARHFPAVILQPYNLNRRAPAGEFGRILEDAADLGAEWIVFLTDEDAEDPDPRIKVKAVETRVEELKRVDATLASRIRVFGVCRCLEAWLLADSAAINRVFPKAGFKLKGKTDHILDCKREANLRVYARHYQGTYSFTERDLAEKMGCRVDFDRASRYSDSLHAFWEWAKQILMG